MRRALWMILALFALPAVARAEGAERVELGATNGYSVYGAHVGLGALWRHGVTPRAYALWRWPAERGQARGLLLAASFTRTVEGGDDSFLHLSGGGRSPRFVDSWIAAGSLSYVWLRRRWRYWAGFGLSGESETQVDASGEHTTRRLVWPELVAGARYTIPLGRSLALSLDLDVGTLLFYWRATASMGLSWTI